jgi:hypothetical protein
MAARARGDVCVHVVAVQRLPAVAVLEGEQPTEAAVAADQRAHDRPDGRISDRDRPVLALLGDVVERHAVARDGGVLLLQRRRTVVMVQLGVLFPADAEQAQVDQPDRGGDHPIMIEAAAAEILQCC